MHQQTSLLTQPHPWRKGTSGLLGGRRATRLTSIVCHASHSSHREVKTNHLLNGVCKQRSAGSLFGEQVSIGLAGSMLTNRDFLGSVL